MKSEITTDHIASDDVSNNAAEPTTEPSRKQSLNLKVRARVGVETRTQLHAGLYGNDPSNGISKAG